MTKKKNRKNYEYKENNLYFLFIFDYFIKRISKEQKSFYEKNMAKN